MKLINTIKTDEVVRLNNLIENPLVLLKDLNMKFLRNCLIYIKNIKEEP